jgi:hypothetical protein
VLLPVASCFWTWCDLGCHPQQPMQLQRAALTALLLQERCQHLLLQLLLQQQRLAALLRLQV